MLLKEQSDEVGEKHAKKAWQLIEREASVHKDLNASSVVDYGMGELGIMDAEELVTMSSDSIRNVVQMMKENPGMMLMRTMKALKKTLNQESAEDLQINK